MSDRRRKNGSGGGNKLIGLPKRLTILSFKHDTPLPANEVKVNVTNEKFIELLKEQPFFVAIPKFRGEENWPPVGTLSYFKKDSLRTIGGKSYIDMQFLSRVNISDVKVRHEALGGVSVHDCIWSDFISEDISREVWDSNGFRNMLAKFRISFSLVALPIYSFLLSNLSSAIRSAAAPAAKTGKYDILQLQYFLAKFEELMGSAWPVKRSDLCALIDKIAWHLCRFFSTDIMPGSSVDTFRDMRLILFSKNVEKRAHLLLSMFERYQEAEASEAANDYLDSILPKGVREVIKRLSEDAGQDSVDGRVNATYIDWLLSLPWKKSTEDEKNPERVKEILEEDHYGLEEVKDRILDFLAVRMTKSNAKAPILCFVGPPGVGKTSLGQSIARALKRKFVRRSLGGLKDEADLRGHRRTYISALPGTIIQGLREAGSRNPVFMLDEIDKLGQHGRDIPEHALVEILDPAQNFSFRDHYIDYEFDLSEVLFIATANTTETIHRALLNRMEVIELNGYTEDEKTEIAARHIIPRVMIDVGIEPENLKQKQLPLFSVVFEREAISALVGHYTHDVGMRDAERHINRVARKILRQVHAGKIADIMEDVGAENGALGDNKAENLQGGPSVIKVTPELLRKYLKKPKTHEWLADMEALPPGVGIALVVHENGQGGVVFAEVSTEKADRFGIKCTGHLSKVMTESIEVARSRLMMDGGILDGWKEKSLIHVHFDEGAIPKDGPSAGVITFCALYSALMKTPIKPLFSVTGEIPKQMNVIGPVGGIVAKLLVARKRGLREVAIPLANRDDLDEFLVKDVLIVTPENREGRSWREISKEPKKTGTFAIYCVEKPEDVLEIAFPDKYPPPKQ